ncbi:MAG TPA: sigma-70 family RNA polymerase sigma factor [Caldithrix abyssi]|uniref:Sigma-70 family RNA polymerase sigma factor n=1 Tax=Caldithrix abyssi TaxID=187145 RepID=A0A7V1LYW6_CALAY|nr:sigma-70 family RNA polymerase sigma factor [Caldithrix abyssi]
MYESKSSDGMSQAMERHWVEETLHGNKQAFGHLVKRYMQRSYYVALGFVHNHEQALDISQEAFAKAYYSLNRFDLQKPFFPWLYRIVKNLSLNEIRNRKNRTAKLQNLAFLDFSHTVVEEDRPLEKEELKKEVWQAIDSLKPAEKEIILLREFQEYSYQEIAEMLEIPVGTVMSRLYTARKALKEQLKHKVADLI